VRVPLCVGLALGALRRRPRGHGLRGGASEERLFGLGGQGRDGGIPGEEGLSFRFASSRPVPRTLAARRRRRRRGTMAPPEHGRANTAWIAGSPLRSARR